MNIKDISILVNEGNDFYLMIGDFLDEFLKKSITEKTELLEEKPTKMEREEYLPFLAAMAHKLSNDNAINTPMWVFDEDCYLAGNNPFFTNNVKGNLRLLFMYKSPAEFKHRNLFVDENVLERV